MLQRSSSRGLTVIELAAVLVMVGITMALGVPAFTAWMADSQVRSAAESIKNGLQLARAEAIRRNTGVSFELNPSSGVMWRVCCDAAGETVQSRPTIEAGGSGLTLSPSITTTLSFSGMGRVANWNSGWGNALGISVTRNAARSMQIALSASGAVRMCHRTDQSTTKTCFDEF